MKRLCVYLIYDRENIISRYITYLLKEIRSCVDRILVVCNSKSAWYGEQIDLYADEVIYRDNLGYDAGGYKDALCDYIGWDRLREYDELILANDSFYGPIWPFSEVFSSMSNVKADYWGMTRSQGEIKTDGTKYEEHIQSYFLVFRKNVISSKVFRTYWEELKYPTTMENAIDSFELGINRCLKQRSFQGAAVSDLYSDILRFKENENPYKEYPLELIRDMRIPVFKRKCIALGNRCLVNALKTFEYIGQNSSYDVQLIVDHLERLERRINRIGLERFYETHSGIYIYGAGVYGRNMARYFEYRKWRHKGFLVTNRDDTRSDCMTFDETDIGKEDGIIIAVSDRQAFLDISENVKRKCRNEQIFNMEPFS